LRTLYNDLKRVQDQYLRLLVRRQLLSTARQDRGHRRAESTRRDHPRCRPRREAVRPSFHTSARPVPTSQRLRRSPALEESV
jgi:hypothetical protein